MILKSLGHLRNVVWVFCFLEKYTRGIRLYQFRQAEDYSKKEMSVGTLMAKFIERNHLNMNESLSRYTFVS